MDDIRYSELVYLQKLATGALDFCDFNAQSKQPEVVGLPPEMYIDMAVTLLEESFLCFDQREKQLFVGRLRGELSSDCPSNVPYQQWSNPRQTIRELLSRGCVYKLCITYRGLRRIEELRDLLRRDRILERFGVLLDWRYVHNDLRDALHRPLDTPISVLYADLDNFKRINDDYGHEAGDVTLKTYLEIVRDSIGSFGTAYRGTGDEVVAIIVGQGHERALEFAEKIRASVQAMKCEHKDKRLPSVTTCIGVATTPPESRTLDIQSVADARNGEAKKAGKNRVISEPSKAKKKLGPR